MLGGQYLPRFLSSTADPQEIAIETDLANRVHAAVAQLPPSQREAVTLCYLSGLTYQEMTTALGIRLGAVKARLMNKGPSRSRCGGWISDATTRPVRRRSTAASYSKRPVGSDSFRFGSEHT